MSIAAVVLGREGPVLLKPVSSYLRGSQRVGCGQASGRGRAGDKRGECQERAGSDMQRGAKVSSERECTIHTGP